MNPPKRILLAPLDWGLGHATRCIPIIHALLQEQQTVFVASAGGALQLLKKEFPQLSFFELPAYKIKYKRADMVVNMALQAPRILYTIKKEHTAIKRLVEENQIDIIISDNRYGCYSASTYNVFITHQLNIKAPYYFLEKLMALGNHYYLQRFDECWVPDFEEEAISLAAELSHGTTLKNVKYIGPLSRMRQYSREIAYDLVVVLSGPEPQRTYLEEMVMTQLSTMPIKACLVQGKAQKDNKIYVENGVKVFPYLTSEALNDLMLSAKLVLSRSGYSTIMDLAFMGQKAMLVPTPGQTEQEYLAEYFCNKKCFFFKKQSAINLHYDYEVAMRFSGIPPSSKHLRALEASILTLISI